MGPHLLPRARKAGMETYEDILRHMVVNDRRFVAEQLYRDHSIGEVCGLDDRSKSLVRVAALITHGGSAQTFRWTVGDALEAGVTPDQIVGTMLAIAPLVGAASIVSTARKVALALDYDVDAVLESLDS